MSSLAFLSKLFINELIDCDIKPMLCGQQLKAERIRQGLAKALCSSKVAPLPRWGMLATTGAATQKHTCVMLWYMCRTKTLKHCLRNYTEGVNREFYHHESIIGGNNYIVMTKAFSTAVQTSVTEQWRATGQKQFHLFSYLKTDFSLFLCVPFTPFTLLCTRPTWTKQNNTKMCKCSTANSCFTTAASAAPLWQRHIV